ncbi:hypothetical protein Trydic_g14567 [Trypoxylus dichotomus]
MHDITTVKARVVERYKKTLRTIWMSELTAKHKSTATNTSIRWNVGEINQLDRDTRKTLTLCRNLHPNASVQRLYLPRREGGRGLINIEWLHTRLVIGAVYQIRRSSDPPMCMVREAEKDGIQGTFLLKAAALKIPFDAAPASRKKDNILEKPKQELKTLLKRAVCQHLKEEHLQKPMHGQYFKLVSEQGLSPELSFSYLTSPTLYSETEGYITAKRVLGMQLGDTRSFDSENDSGLYASVIRLDFHPDKFPHADLLSHYLLGELRPTTIFVLISRTPRNLSPPTDENDAEHP